MSFRIDEDPRRTIYQIPDQALGLPIFDPSHLEDDGFIGSSPQPSPQSVSKRKIFAYKKFDPPIYAPGDSKHILNEITALAQFRGQPNIAQLIGVVISGDPYKTRLPKSRVIIGFLLEIYTGGSLK